MDDDRLQESLVAACAAGDLVEIRKLVAAGANINAQGMGRRRALTWPVLAAAGSKNAAEVLEVLLGLGADLTLAWGPGVLGDAAMTEALACGQADAVQLLRAQGLTVRPDALVRLCLYGSKKEIAFCLAQGCDPAGQEFIGIGRTVLHTLADGELPDAAALAADFIDRGAHLEARDRYDRTPLYAAAFQGRIELVKLYLARGADPNATAEGKSIHDAAKNQTIRKLLKGIPSAPSPKKKAKAAGRLRSADLEKVYAAFQGNFFEGPWEGEATLARALFAFATEHHTAFAEEAGDDAVALESLLRDEAGPEAMAAFLDGLPPKAFAAACVSVADALDEMDDADATKWAKKLRAAAKSA